MTAAHAPKVSVILPTYQRVELLRGVVRNLLAQTLTDIEVLVLDDGSTDGTAAAMQAMTDPRLRFFSPGRLGIPGIVNNGFERARGEYVIICHDHDEYDPTMLRQFADFLDARPNVTYVFSGLILCAPDGVTEVRRDIHAFPDVTPGREFLLQQLMPRVDSCIGVFTMFRRSPLQGRFLLPEVGGCADVELWHRLCLAGDVGYIKTPLIRVRGRDPRSQFFLAEADLLSRVLRAKLLYLSQVGDLSAQTAMKKRWQTMANRTVLSNLFKALRANDRAPLPFIRKLADEWGSGWAQATARIMPAVPRPIGLAMLGAVRVGARVAQGRWSGI